MKKFKIGDKVRVIENISYHGFEIGQIVTINSNINDEGYFRASNGKYQYWVKSYEINKVSLHSKKDVNKVKVPNKKHIEVAPKMVIVTRTYTLNGTFTEEELRGLLK